MQIETPRLFLREMNELDYNALYAVLADSDIMQHYPYTFDEKRVRGWISKNIERYKVFGFGLWAVCLKENGEMIGDCGLTMQNINGSIRPEIGYHIRKDMQRKGYAKEAATAVRDWAFENTPFLCLYSYMKKTNIPSEATAKTIGMQFVCSYTDDEGEQTSVYAIKKTTEYSLRLATREEIPLLTAVSKAAFDTDISVGAPGPGGPPGYDSQEWHLEMLNGGHLFTFLENDKVIGGAVLFASEKKLYIGRIFISPARFRQGLGLKLMDFIEKQNNPGRPILLDTPVWNVRTIFFYNHCGYSEKHRDAESVYFQK